MHTVGSALIGSATHRWRQCLLVAAVVALSLTSAGSAVVHAHALLERSEPAAGTVAAADTPPDQISLWFSEPISVTFNGISVLDADNRRVDGLDANVSPIDPTR